MTLETSTIALIGLGNMGQALAAGWLGRGVRAESIVAIDPGEAARAAAGALGIRVIEPTELANAGVDVVVLAVKPAQLESVLAQIRDAGAPLYLSIVAGKTIGAVRRVVGESAIVRAMPNTPAAIGQGVTGLCASPAVTEEQRLLCGELMTAVGSVEWVVDEAMMDAVTAVSGSGPAYVFLLIECLASAAREVGLDAALAARLATATVAGAGAYAARSGESAAELRRRVTSPNGTTEAALAVLMRNDALVRLLTEAVQAAERRSRELSNE